MWMLWTALLGLVGFIALGYLERKHKRNGVYTQPGICYDLKRVLSLAHLRFVRLRRPRRVHCYHSGDAASFERSGLVPCPEDEEAERARSLDTPGASDSVSFFGSDSEGRQLVTRLVRRPGRQAELLLLLHMDGQLYQLPGMPDTTVYNTGSGWAAAGLKFECVVPMQLWRITYRGQLRRYSETAWREGKIDDSVPDAAWSATYTGGGADGGAACELVPAQLSLLWQPLSAPHDLRHCGTDLMAHGVASELWTPEFLSLMGSFSLDGYVQFGCLRGEVSVAGAAPLEVRLRGPRLRCWSEADGPQTAPRHRALRIQARLTDGSQLLIAADSWKAGISHLVYGVYMSSALKMSPLTSCSLSLPDLAEDGTIPDVFNFIFSADGKDHAVSFLTAGPPIQAFCGRPWQWVDKLQIARVCVDGTPGTALAEFGYPYSGPCPLRPEISLPLLVSSPLPADPALVVTFSDPACRCEALVGGKAASLALLTDLDLAEVTVPRGVVVTAAAYRAQLRRHAPLRHALQEVERVSSGVQDGDLALTCQRAVEAFESTAVDETILEELETSLKEEFGDISELHFAVRSSALGEDGEELSSAGQNETALGCRGLTQLCAALARCWASLLALQSVQYRRQHGQHACPGMAVVVQLMVPSEVSGVLLTRDPVTGDTTTVTITANFGLGETVVSATAEPDTVVLSRSHTDQLTVVSRQLGSKQKRTVMKEDGGTEEVTVDSAAAGAVCLSDATALTLARVGLHLEQAFGGPRDIEWAVAQGRVYLLQSRPVTSGTGWSEFELTHEFDSALLTDNECHTTANVGEVLPGVISPLTINISVLGFNVKTEDIRRFLMGKGNVHCPAYTRQYMPIIHQHLSMNVIMSFYSSLQSWEEEELERAIQLTIFGHLVDLAEARRLGVQRHGLISSIVNNYQKISVMRMTWRHKSEVERARAEYGSFTLKTSGQLTAQEMFRRIRCQLTHQHRVILRHVWVTSFSNILQVVLLTALSDNGRNGWDQELYSAFATLLSSCNGAESADVPAALKRLARLIVAAEDCAEFVSASAEEALHWLRHRHTAVAAAFDDFMASHGHRGVKELELLQPSWEMEPAPLIATLQAMARSPDSLQDRKTDLNEEEALSQLKLPLSAGSRRFIKFLLPYTRRCVVYREMTKSLLVRVTHQFRLAFRRLGELMVREGRLPDLKLIFFMELREIQILLDTRSPSIIIKAARRRRLAPRLASLQFPELMYGVPRPLEPQRPAADARGQTVVSGTPVCQGRVDGVARVVRTVADAGQIQRDDILVTHATDIGWSPFFPVVSGVVTELGGLISHGAVVAREYGLPCVVGATGATEILRSGDRVILDGTQGTITRIGHAE